MLIKPVPWVFVYELFPCHRYESQKGNSEKLLFRDYCLLVDIKYPKKIKIISGNK